MRIERDVGGQVLLRLIRLSGRTRGCLSQRSPLSTQQINQHTRDDSNRWEDSAPDLTAVAAAQKLNSLPVPQ
jgi:hypothetical protein